MGTPSTQSFKHIKYFSTTSIEDMCACKLTKHQTGKNASTPSMQAKHTSS